MSNSPKFSLLLRSGHHPWQFNIRNSKDKIQKNYFIVNLLKPNDMTDKDKVLLNHF